MRHERGARLDIYVPRGTASTGRQAPKRPGIMKAMLGGDRVNALEIATPQVTSLDES